MSEPRQDGAGAVPGETLPPAPPLWVCDGCMDTHTWPEAPTGARPMGWRTRVPKIGD